MARLIALLWLSVPLYVVGQALYGIWRRWRLIRDPVPVEARVDEVRASHVERLEDATVVDLTLIFRVDGMAFTHHETRADHQRQHYAVGETVVVLHERGRPGNVMSAGARPWDDVSGPLVFGLLLLIFMTWLLLFVSSLQITN